MKRLAAVLVAGAVLSGGVVGAVSLRGEPARTSLDKVAIDESPDVVVPSPDAAAPSATASPSAVASATATASPSLSSVGPSSTPSAAPKPGVWTRSGNGATVTLAIDPPSPRAGEAVTWTVTVTGATFATIAYGDGDGTEVERREYCSGDEPYESRAGATTVRYLHAYRRAGTYAPTVTVTSDCGSDAPRLTLKPSVRVGRGPLLSNGPWVPRVHVGRAAPEAGDDPAVQAYLSATSFDQDGTPLSLRWDFGDGSKPVVETFARCTWPAGGGWAGGSRTSRAGHTWPDPGKYVVTVDVTTGGCDGKGAQVVTKTFEVSVTASGVSLAS